MDLIEMARTSYSHVTNPNDRGIAERGLFGCSTDLADGFYQFKCAAITSLFGLGFQATVREMETMFTVTMDTVYDDEKAGQVPFRKEKSWSAAFLRCLRVGPGLFSVVMMPFRTP